MSAFTAALISTSLDIAEIRNDVLEMKSQLKELEVAELRQAMAAKEQRGFRNDVEITGLTENKSENLYQIVSVLSTDV